ncbi:uncharacterized protein BCR38DRAFT_409010 [Pseudomassariella vexata]|uniref:Histidine phosphatase superfamily n=1 Tax=Pseudomassariella vexata TaxID=1141098 RepID=A0A1Y2E1R4_9PEZI|nr:uncharacterized protein BCR38DRAFT_409010 [Pseudomassariella vexata]ORY65294.1 hypothetical protein BCR38DRAFT_409010 [Pseudomassariella vexata]
MSDAVYNIQYVRHVKSESNKPYNANVHNIDPPLLSWELESQWAQESGQEGPKQGQGEGFDLIRNQVALHLADLENDLEEPPTQLIAVSPLLRTLQTCLMGTPYHLLARGNRQVQIVIHPVLVEQTYWISDRVRPTEDIKATISDALENREYKPKEMPLTINDLNIDWDELNRHWSDDGVPGDLEYSKTLKLWNVKERFWAPENVIERGQAANRALIRLCRELCNGTRGKGAQKPGDFTLMVFGHGGFINFLAEELGNVNSEADQLRLTDWNVGEIRRYELAEADYGGDNCYLKENPARRNCRLRLRGEPSVGDYDRFAENEKRVKLRGWLKNLKEELLVGKDGSGGYIPKEEMVNYQNIQKAYEEERAHRGK